MSKSNKDNNQKETCVFKDKNVIPTDDFVFSILGEKKLFWKSIMEYAGKKEITGNWNYYNDGKQWLYKAVRKNKTVFWIAILQDTFRITFYFGDKAEPILLESDLPGFIKEGFKTGKRYGKIRAITLKMNNMENVNIAQKLIDIKSKLK
jgi:hypothetical protein